MATERSTTDDGASTRGKREGLLFGLAGMLAFSGTLPATKIAVPEMGPFFLTFGRLAIAGLLGALSLALVRRWPRPSRRHWTPILVMGVGLSLGYPFFIALALTSVPAAHAAVVTGLIPALTAVLAVVRNGERPGIAFWISCGIGTCAVVAFALHDRGGALQAGDGWLVLAILSVAIAYVEGGRISGELGGANTLCLAMTALLPVSLAGVAVTWTAHYGVKAELSTAAWLSFAYAGLISMFVGSIAWYRGLAVGGVARIGQLNLALPFTALIWSHYLLREAVGRFAVVCAAIVLLATAACLAQRSKTPDGG